VDAAPMVSARKHKKISGKIKKALCLCINMKIH
jgi:hypothetical protein